MEKRTRKIWTPLEDEEFRLLYADSDNQVLMEKFGVTLPSVYHRAYTLGLKKSESFMHEQHKRLMEKIRPFAVQFQIKKGNIPFNKGKKMSAEQKEKCKHTFFQKGHKPVNTFKPGINHVTIRTDKRTGNAYKWFKVSDGKWVLYHRKVYEDAHGKLTRNEMITFKDGNSINCELENLEVISMYENRIRNGSVGLPDKYVANELAKEGKQVNQELKELFLKSPELINLKRNQIKLNRLCKEN